MPGNEGQRGRRQRDAVAAPPCPVGLRLLMEGNVIIAAISLPHARVEERTD